MEIGIASCGVSETDEIAEQPLSKKSRLENNEKKQYNLKHTCTFLVINSSSIPPFPTGIVEEESKNKMRIS
ncbi:hypothetical protein BpHYR1_020141 [Brachionus plicatilis]|uniref:Uncharacterized protein n=1 Tax=Brachionus plicatilis TaxID=10195 RepID=A0A3M7REN2_BRAPC|nr:hypothetical protein BpHYR1_020141 [Brachionus plicatilis]